MTHSDTRRPSFFWQGVLILCPALALACFVLFALYRESRFSQQQLTMDGSRVAERFTAKFNSTVESNLTLLLHFQNQPLLDPAQDLISVLQNGDVACFTGVIDSSNQLVYPPPSIAAEQYEFPVDDINRTQLALYDDYSNFVLANGTNSETQYQALMSSGVTEPWLSNAKYQHSVALSREGDLERAGVDWMEIIRNRPPIPTRSGWPLQVFAAIQVLRFHLVQPEKEEALNRACSLAIYSGMEDAGYILGKLGSYAGTNSNSSNTKMKAILAGWESVRKTHERVRSAFAALPALANSPMEIIENDSSRVLVWAHKLDNRTAILIQDHDCLAGTAKKTAAETELPQHLGLRLVHAENTFWSSFSPASLDELLTTSPGPGNLQVATFLIDPGYRLRLLKKRLLIILGLCVAEAVILIGFIASWKAFQKQRQISEMRSNFVSSVSHELRAPIASLRLMAEELALDDSSTSSRSHQYHSLMTRECQRLSRLIENVLNFSRQDSGKQTYHFEQKNLNTVVTSATSILEPTAALAQLHIQYRLDATRFPAADSSAFTQVVINLVENAIKHSPPGKIIELITISNENEFVFSVIDHGSGIPIEEQDRIFEQFYRPGSEMRRETQGVGLGLAIVENICAAHGAKIRLKSKPGEGSTFSIHFLLDHQKEHS
ncbi:MAG: integral rane sensor signal transduction histidine kinase [Verrucomicrobiales bacterium]|nr:integral rane sensor signal transduction histidine kinase [Verrucomicrobiales bacterium]